MGQEIELDRACGVFLRVEDALVWYTSGQAQKKHGEAKIQARSILTPFAKVRWKWFRAPNRNRNHHGKTVNLTSEESGV